MKELLTARSVAELFCSAWFEERNVCKAADYLAENIDFVGMGEKQVISGKTTVAAYISHQAEEMSEPLACRFSVVYEQPLGEYYYNLSAALTLKNSFYMWHLRAFFNLSVNEFHEWKIQSLHMSETGGRQAADICSSMPLVQEYPCTKKIKWERQKLLTDAVPGGMMGEYIEEGYPFYFINQKMLSYLGYESEEQFIQDTQGMIANCIHPKDREAVNEAVESQLAVSDQYTVDYRLRKRDGSYIWVRDQGRRTAAEDGRPVLTSVCIDITEQKQSQEEILNLYNNIPGAVFCCGFDPDFTVFSANDGLFEFLGYTREEFAAMGNKMSAVIYPEDFEILMEKFEGQLQRSNTVQYEHRFVCRGETIKWVSMKAQFLREEAGEKYFYCVFVDITDSKLLQEHVKELYEQEMAYFASLSSSENSIQGRFNVTGNRLENYLCTSDTAIARVGDSYDETIKYFSESAVEPEDAELIRDTLERKKVLADYAAGKADYQFSFLRKRNDGSNFWGNTSFRFCTNPETGEVVAFSIQ